MERYTPHAWRKTFAFDTPSESINKQNKKWKLIFLIAMATVDTFSPSTLRQIFFIDETDGVMASHFASARFWHRWACASKGTQRGSNMIGVADSTVPMNVTKKMDKFVIEMSATKKQTNKNKRATRRRSKRKKNISTNYIANQNAKYVCVPSVSCMKRLHLWSLDGVRNPSSRHLRSHLIGKSIFSWMTFRIHPSNQQIYKKKDQG